MPAIIKKVYFVMILRIPALLILLLLEMSVFANADTDSRLLLKQLLINKNKLPAPVYQYYQETDFSRVWMQDNVLLPKAYDLYSVLTQADSKGLDIEGYGLDAIRKRWNIKDSVVRTELEILLTHAFEKYSRHVANGRWEPYAVDPQWHINVAPLNIKKILTLLQTATVTEVFKRIEPGHNGYQALLKHLNAYQAIARQGGWVSIAPGPVVRPGQHHSQVPHIRQRLKVTNDLIANSTDTSDRMDVTLVEAVKLFQARHGLAIDGAVGLHTRAAMNVPVEERIDQIRVNVERWRWLPSDLGKRYLLINLAGFELYAREHGKTVLAMPVIIGKQYRETPSFSGKVRYLEINPYWTVPKSIVLKDLIPAQLRDPDFFKRKKIRVFDGWTENAKELDITEVPLRKLNNNYFPYRFRQDPGPTNSLGRVKFMFPNPYDIYLHDTPKRYLFDRQVRAFSSGCIRVSDAVRLTAYLLNAPTQKKEEDVLRWIYREENRALSLVHTVPVYLLYMTAWADWDGKLNFRNDIYGRDALMINELNKNKIY